MAPPEKRRRGEGGGAGSGRHWAAELERGPQQLKLLVSDQAAACLIGRGGLNLQRVESSTGCSVKVSGARVFYPGTCDRVVDLAGDEAELHDALGAVVDACRAAQRLESERTGEAMEAEASIGVVLPTSACSLVTGSDGRSLARRTRIALSLGEGALADERVAVLAGASPDVTEAAREICRLMQQDTGEDAYTRFASRQASPSPWPASRTSRASQPRARVSGMPEGAHEETPWRQRAGGRALPWTGPGSAAPGHRPGPAAPWARQPSSEPPRRLPRQALGRPGGESPTEEASEGAALRRDGDLQCSIFFGASEQEAGCIIGKGGDFVRHVIHQTGAWVEVSNRGDYVPGTMDRRVTIKGGMTRVHAAHALVLERICSGRGE